MTEIENKQPTSWTIHAVLLCLRLALSVLVLVAMPFAHVHWGAAYPGDGQRAFAMVAAFGLVGGAAAVVYFLVASILHYALRKKTWQRIALLDGSLGMLFAVALLVAGASAKYEEAPNQPSQPTPSGRG